MKSQGSMRTTLVFRMKSSMAIKRFQAMTIFLLLVVCVVYFQYPSGRDEYVISFFKGFHHALRGDDAIESALKEIFAEENKVNYGSHATLFHLVAERYVP